MSQEMAGVIRYLAAVKVCVQARKRIGELIALTESASGALHQCLRIDVTDKDPVFRTKQLPGQHEIDEALAAYHQSVKAMGKLWDEVSVSDQELLHPPKYFLQPKAN